LNSQGGVFFPRLPSYKIECDVHGTNYKLSVKEKISHRTWLPTIKPCPPLEHPLQNWVLAFKERLLASRIVHYTPRELVWECNTLARCECSGLEWPHNSNPTAGEAAQVGKTIKTRYASAIWGCLELKDKLKVWEEIIGHYTAKELPPNQSDRLKYLAAIARRFSSPELGRYLAGHWAAALPCLLEWTLMSELPKPAVWRAPSWSWASCDG
jgi:hypothetical protein